MESNYCPHCGARHFPTDFVCLNCKQTLREYTPTPEAIPPSPPPEIKPSGEREGNWIYRMDFLITLAMGTLCLYFTCGPLIIPLVIVGLLGLLWDWNDTRNEEERGRRILAAGSDKAAVQAELARYHSDEPRQVQTRYGLYEVSAFDSRLGADAGTKNAKNEVTAPAKRR